MTDEDFGLKSSPEPADFHKSMGKDYVQTVDKVVTRVRQDSDSRPAGAINRAFLDLEEALADAEKFATDHIVRLQPFLHDSDETDGPAKSSTEPMEYNPNSHVAQEMEALTVRVRRLTRRLQDAHNRIDL